MRTAGKPAYHRAARFAGDVDSRDRWAWDGLRFALPMTESGGLPRDMISGVSGTMNGATVWAQCEAGPCIDFTGADTDSVTFASVLPAAYTSTTVVIDLAIDAYDSSGAVPFDIAANYWWWDTGDDKVYVQSLPLTETIVTGLDDSVWRRVVLVYDKPGFISRAYFDGVMVASKAGYATDLSAGAKTLTLGKYSGHANTNLDGRIASARFYDRPWSAAEVAADIARPFGWLERKSVSAVGVAGGAPPAIVVPALDEGMLVGGLMTMGGGFD